MGEVILLGRTHCQLGLTKGQRRAKKRDHYGQVTYAR
jgi:hypothetical protein